MLEECGGGRVGVRVREGEREAGQRGGLSPWSGVRSSRFVVLALRQRSGREGERESISRGQWDQGYSAPMDPVMDFLAKKHYKGL